MIRFEEHLPPWKAPPAYLLKLGLTLAEWRLCRTPRSGPSTPKPAGGQFYRTYSNVRQVIGELRAVIATPSGLAVETVRFQTPLAFRRAPSHAVGLDVRPYLGYPPPRPGPLFRLHDFLEQLDRPQPLETPVRATRARATDVVPLPEGVQGRWEGWTVEQPVPRRCAICRESIAHLRTDATVCRKQRCRVADWRLRNKATPARRAA